MAASPGAHAGAGKTPDPPVPLELDDVLVDVLLVGEAPPSPPVPLVDDATSTWLPHATRASASALVTTPRPKALPIPVISISSAAKMPARGAKCRLKPR
jgi:hypothetical protein